MGGITPFEKFIRDGVTEKESTNSLLFGVRLNGNYWISLSDAISYTPGIYLSYISSSTKIKEEELEGKLSSGGFGFGLSLIKLNCKLNDKMSLTFEAGHFGYTLQNSKTSEGNYSQEQKSNNLQFNFNTGGSIAFRYWL